MLGDSININNLCCNPVVLKKKKIIVKPQENCYFLGLLTCAKKGSAWATSTVATSKMKNKFLAKVTKPD